MNNIDFNRIYERNYHRSFFFFISYVHDDMAAEDIAIESLYKYWQVLKNQTDEISEALLVAIIKNKSIDYLRKEQLHQSMLENYTELFSRDLEIRLSSLEACNPTELFSAEIQTMIRNTLKELPPQTRRIFELSRYENMSVKEIAEITGLTPKAVEYHITKSLRALRVSLKDYLPILILLLAIK